MFVPGEVRGDPNAGGWVEVALQQLLQQVGACSGVGKLGDVVGGGGQLGEAGGGQKGWWWWAARLVVVGSKGWWWWAAKAGGGGRHRLGGVMESPSAKLGGCHCSRHGCTPTVPSCPHHCGALQARRRGGWSCSPWAGQALGAVPH